MRSTKAIMHGNNVNTHNIVINVKLQVTCSARFHILDGARDVLLVIGALHSVSVLQSVILLV